MSRNRNDRRRPGAEASASTPVSQRELDSELRGISFKLRVIGGLAALNIPLNVAALVSKGALPSTTSLLHRFFS